MTAGSSLTLLLIDECSEDRIDYCRLLQQDPHYTYRLIELETVAAAKQWWQQESADVILLALCPPEGSDLTPLEDLRQFLSEAQAAIIVLIQQDATECAVQAMKSGAQDCLIKEKLTPDRLQRAIHSAVTRLQLARNLEYSQKQQQLLATSALRIRQLLDVEILLPTTVIEVRELLGADRVLVYQFHSNFSGTVITESVQPGYPVMLGASIAASCFQPEADSGQGRAIATLDQAELTDEDRHLLDLFEVKAQMVSPIWVNESFWGLLIVHQCSRQRQWQSVELALLDQLTVQLAIALQQTSADQQSRLLFENNPIPMWVFNPQTLAFLAVNNAAIARYGYSQKEFLALTIADIRPPEDVPRLLQTVQTVEEGWDQAGTWRHCLKDGTLIWVDITSHAIDFCGRRAELVMAQDITSRHHAEQQLRDSEARFRTFMDHSPAAAWITDVQGQMEYASQAYSRMFQIPSDVVGRSVFDLYPPEMAQVYVDNIQAVGASGQGLEAIEPGIRPDGSAGEFLVFKFPLPRSAETLSIGGVAIDITDRKKAEAARLQAEKLRLELTLLENILDIILAGYWDWDIANHQVYLSPGLKRMFGYETDELPNSLEAWQGLILPEDLLSFLECFERHVQSRGQIPFYTEVRYRHKNGSTVWVICSGKVIEWDLNDKPMRMIGCHIDSTERKQAEERVLKSDTHLRAAQRIGKLGSWEFEIGTGQITWSEEVFRIFGRSLTAGPPTYEELQQIFHPEDRLYHQQTVQTALETGQPYEIEARAYRPDGSLVNILARGEPILDAAGLLVQFIGTILDISDRKQTEQQLWNLSNRLTLALQSGAIGTWDWDLIDDASWDERMYEIYGLQHLGRPVTYSDWVERLHSEDSAKAEAAFQAAVRGEQDFDIEFRIWRLDGEQRWIRATALVQRNAQGEPLRMTGLNYDITAQKQVETQLLQTTAQLIASNQELEAFSYSVSHDLRAPLRAIDGFSKALLEDYGVQFDAVAQDYFNRIRYNVQRMGMLIDDLLRLSRVTRSEMQYASVNLSALVEEQLRELQASEPTRQVESVVAPNVTVYADPNLLRIALSNLLQNAWKFTSHHPTARLQFGTIPAQGHVIYFVRDDGAGFDMAFSSQLFGVFQRLHNTPEFPGMGIGLATVQRIIHRHGGLVWAEGAVEQGATLYFTLPDVHITTGT